MHSSAYGDVSQCELLVLCFVTVLLCQPWRRELNKMAIVLAVVSVLAYGSG